MTRNDSVSTLNFDVVEILVGPCMWLEDETCNPAQRALATWQATFKAESLPPPLEQHNWQGFSLGSGDEKGKRGGRNDGEIPLRCHCVFRGLIYGPDARFCFRSVPPFHCGGPTEQSVALTTGTGRLLGTMRRSPCGGERTLTSEDRTCFVLPRLEMLVGILQTYLGTYCSNGC
jgi:hypothetical protein